MQITVVDPGRHVTATLNDGTVMSFTINSGTVSIGSVGRPDIEEVPLTLFGQQLTEESVRRFLGAAGAG